MARLKKSASRSTGVYGLCSDTGKLGVLTEDGSVLPFDHPDAEGLQPTGKKAYSAWKEAEQQALSQIANIRDESPFPFKFIQERPELIQWLIGKNPTYAPSPFERFIILPAYRERERRLHEAKIGDSARLRQRSKEDELPELRHSEDFESVVVNGVEYLFNNEQAKLIEALWIDAEKGHSAVSLERVRDVLDNREWSKVFRDHPFKKDRHLVKPDRSKDLLGLSFASEIQPPKKSSENL